jgi:hypothetical protein
MQKRGGENGRPAGRKMIDEFRTPDMARDFLGICPVNELEKRRKK